MVPDRDAPEADIEALVSSYVVQVVEEGEEEAGPRYAYAGTPATCRRSSRRALIKAHMVGT